MFKIARGKFSEADTNECKENLRQVIINKSTTVLNFNMGREG